MAEIPPELIEKVIVFDHGSMDGTGEIARRAGAAVVFESRRGYGYRCAAGAATLESNIVVFMDGDGGFVPVELSGLIEVLADGKAVLALCSRNLRPIKPGAMPPH